MKTVFLGLGLLAGCTGLALVLSEYWEDSKGPLGCGVLLVINLGFLWRICRNKS